MAAFEKLLGDIRGNLYAVYTQPYWNVFGYMIPVTNCDTPVHEFVFTAFWNSVMAISLPLSWSFWNFLVIVLCVCD